MYGEPLLPAYGRDYKSLKAVQEAFDADVDFLTSEKLFTKMSELREMHPEVKEFRVRYKNLQETDFVKMPPLPDFGEPIDEPKSEEWAQKGREFKEAKIWDLAIYCFSEAIRLNPVPDESWYERGLVYSELKSPLKAIEDFTETYRRQPSQPYTMGLEERAREYLAIGEYEKAAADMFTRGFETDCGMAQEIFSGSIYGLLNTGEHERAIELISELISLDVDFALEYAADALPLAREKHAAFIRLQQELEN